MLFLLVLKLLWVSLVSSFISSFRGRLVTATERMDVLSFLALLSKRNSATVEIVSTSIPALEHSQIEGPDIILAYMGSDKNLVSNSSIF